MLLPSCIEKFHVIVYWRSCQICLCNSYRNDQTWTHLCRSGLYELFWTLEKARQSIENGLLVAELMQQVHCVAMALKTSMYSHEDATACYELKCLSTLAAFLLRFHSKTRAPPSKNGSTTTTITTWTLGVFLCRARLTCWFELHEPKMSVFMHHFQ